MPAQDTFAYGLTVAASCNAAGGVLTCQVNRVGSGIIVGITVAVVNSLRVAVTSAQATFGSANPVRFQSLPNGVYTVSLEADDGGGTGPAGGTFIKDTTATISCGASAGLLDITVDRIDNPTVRGGLGNVRLNVANAVGNATVYLTLNPPGPVTATSTPGPSGIFVFSGLAAGLYGAQVIDSLGRIDGVPVEILAGPVVGCMDINADNYDPLATVAGACTYTAPRWHAVGGVLPNPALLECPVASLTTTVAGVTTRRSNLHIEVELVNADSGETFARARQTVRRVDEVLDASRYLRSQLAPRISYPARVGAQLDPSSAVAFRYRYREVDAAGVGSWINRPSPRYAVLAALPETTDEPEAYLAGSVAPGRFTTQFATPTQFVGLPLEVGILVPARPAGLNLWAEVSYLDALGAVIERRSALVADDLPAGYLRVGLPDDPLPCAVAAEVALVDGDRSFVGTCPALGGGTGGPVVVTPNPVVLLNIQPGRLKL